MTNVEGGGEATLIHQHPAVSLETLTHSAKRLIAIKKRDLQPGDWVFVKTLRSIYRLRVTGNGMFEVTGGWFDAKGLSPLTTRVLGCTWGGSAIKVDVVAVCGLRLEFGNRLTTSPIQKIFLVPKVLQN